MVVEAHSGAWGGSAKQVWKAIASKVSVVSGEGAELELERGLQMLALTLHKETARAVLRRAHGSRRGAMSAEESARSLLDSPAE